MNKQRVESSNIRKDDASIIKGWKKSFYTIISGQAVSIIGSGAVQFSLIWWLTSEFNSSTILSLAGLLAFLPQAILGPFAGVWVDRIKRKTIMICADLFMGIVAMLLAFYFYLGMPPYWVICIVLGVRAVGAVFHTPAVQSTMPLLVPKEELLRVNSISQLLQTGSNLLAPIIGAAMFSFLPMHIILLTDLVGAIIACSTVAIVKIPELNNNVLVKRYFINDLKEGIKCFMDDKKLSSYTIILFICTMFYMPLGMLFPLMVSDVFKGSEWHASAAQTIYTIGMLSAAMLLGVIGGKIKSKLFASKLGLILFALSLFIGGVLPHSSLGLWIFLITCYFMGMGVNISNIPYISYIQETMPEEKQGRGLSLYYTLVSAAMPIGLIFAGPISETLGLPLWFIIAGIGMILAIFIGKIFEKIWK